MSRLFSLMRDPVVIGWGILAFIIAFALYLIARRRRVSTSGGRYSTYQKIVLVLVAALSSWLLHKYLSDSPHLIWAGRIVILSMGIIDLWVTYKLKFTKRNPIDYEKDSVLIEGLYFLLHAFIASLAFILLHKIGRFVDLTSINIQSTIWWDLPIIFFLPFLILKLSDFGSQMPYIDIENRWVYPLERARIESEQLVDLARIRFRVKDSVRKEYRFLTRGERPWIHAPRGLPLGTVLRVNMQERRNSTENNPINDLGNEHGGNPNFWWLFSVKRIWWNPLTWFRKPRYLNPDVSIAANKLKSYDVVLLRRIPTGEDFVAGIPIQKDFDPDDTVLINR